MKTRTPLAIAGVCGLFVSFAWGAEAPAKSAPPVRPPPAQRLPPGTPASAPTATSQVDAKKEKSGAAHPVSPEKLPPELAASKAIEEANKDHVRPARDRFTMDTPPPPPREDKKPPLPASGMVWVPGHWVPSKGEWQWRTGEWGIPATPISVWIEAKYDPKTKQWSPGYWQPDRITPDQSESSKTEEEHQPSAKFF
jgi:hypothetical protein